MVENAGFEIDVVPVIWNKDHASSAAKLRTYPKAYETIFFCYKGKRDLNITDHDVFTVKRPAGKGRIHSAQKPIELEKKFVIASSYPGERVLVPFAGSGAAIAAAVQENRYGIGIEKSEENFAKMVKFVRSHI
jgi:DNA modification methylase